METDFEFCDCDLDTNSYVQHSETYSSIVFYISTPIYKCALKASGVFNVLVFLKVLLMPTEYRDILPAPGQTRIIGAHTGKDTADPQSPTVLFPYHLLAVVGPSQCFLPVRPHADHLKLEKMGRKES